MKNKNTTCILAFFLGGIGAHRFYLNQIGVGMVYALLCWTFIPAIIGLVDSIIFLNMNENDFNAKYNQEEILTIDANNNVAEELEKLYSLKERGIITQLEYDKRKSKLI